MNFSWRRAVRAVIPSRLYIRLRPGTAHIPIGQMQFGNLRRLEPISRRFGYDRGTPIDRHYIEGFLAAKSGRIQGRVLEIGDNSYTLRFGGSRVTHSDVLHIDAGHSAATFVGDLTNAPHIPDATFDCIIFTQTLQLIFDVQAAIQTLHRILKPSGTLLVTVPGITPIAADRWGEDWFWSFTRQSCERLFGTQFREVKVEQYGNVLAAIAFLEGLAQEELRKEELDHTDRQFPMILAVEARR